MALVPFSGLPSSATVASADILALVVSGTTKKMTAGAFRTQLFAFASADPLNIGALTAVGNSTITGALSGITTLTTANLASTTMTGDLLFTDATYDIGKVGATRPRDLFISRNLNVPGTIAVSGQVTIGYSGATSALYTQVANGNFHTQVANTAGTVVWGTFLANVGKDLVFYDNANGRSALTLAQGATGQATFSHGLTANTLTLVASVGKIIPGATSISHRNNADNADNLLITDAGDVTVRARLIMATASAKVLIGATGLDFRDSADTGSRLLINSASPVVQISNGRLNTAAATTSYASVLIPSGTAPTSPVSGEMWYNGTNLMFRDGGTTRTITWA